MPKGVMMTTGDAVSSYSSSGQELQWKFQIDSLVQQLEPLR